MSAGQAGEQTAALKSAVNRFESMAFRLAEREPNEARICACAVAEGVAAIARAEGRD